MNATRSRKTVDSATVRAKRVGFDAVELHSAHGYFLHQWLSPLSNKRTDSYGLDRKKFPLEVAAAVREAWPKDRALGARITGSDWAEGGITPDDAVAYARELKRIGFDYICVSSGGLPKAKIKVEPNYQVPFAARVRAAVDRSGLTNAQFAELVGTSASRLSTYLSGKVTPSAALLLRMERAASRS